MGALKLSYYEQERDLEINSIFLLSAVEKNALVEKKRVSSSRYGFNGYEKDDEVASNGNHLSFEDYGYSPRLARRWNMDPLWKIFPYQSPYVYALNNPIRFIDEDGEGPGDGVQKLYVTKTTIRTSKGEQTVFLKKRYYENATPKQVKRYKDAAVTANGWYFATKAEYEQFQKDPNQGSFSTTIFGADTPEKKRIAQYQMGGLSGNRIDIAGDRNGVFKALNEDTEGNPGDFTLSVFDKDGSLVGSETQTIEAGATGSFDFNLEEGQYIEASSGGANAATLGVYDKGRKGKERRDNIENYGMESPTSQDKREIGAVLDKRK